MRLDGSLTGHSNAKRLRKEMTPPEIALWLALGGNESGLRFRRQHAAGGYVLDFYYAPARLAIEVDGDAHNHGNRPERDATRDAWLITQDIRVLHYPAREMLANLDDVVRQIAAIAVQRRSIFESQSPPPPPTPTTPPPPCGGGFGWPRSITERLTQALAQTPPPPGGGARRSLTEGAATPHS